MSMTTSSVLIAGLAGAVFMSSHGRELAEQGKHESELWMALDRFASDVAEAQDFFSCADQSVTFEVPDRDGDNVNEMVEYSWSPGGPLQYTYGASGTAVDLTQPLDTLSMRWRSTEPQTTSSSETYDPPGYIFQSHQANWNGDGGFLNSDSGFDNEVTIPETYVTGDLLVAGIVIATEQGDPITANANWTRIFQRNSGNNYSVAVFYTYNPNGSSVTFDWPDKGRSNAVVAHFLAPSTGGYLDQSVVNSGNSNSPTAPATTASEVNSLVVRMLGTRQSSVPEDAANMPDHTTIYFRSGTGSRPAIGMTVQTLPSAGPVAAADFGLTSSQNFTSATLVFAP